MRISVEMATKMLRWHDFIVRRTPSGFGLIVYEGDEKHPHTWMECERMCVDRKGEVPMAIVHKLINVA